MGLDMGLCKKKKVLDSEEVAYWRKANQIREWFVNNLDGFQDEGQTPVEKEDLENLLDTCKEVLENHDLAPELLPVSEGFFFGGNEYDEWYFKDLEETVEMLSEVIENTNWDEENIYYWEWY